MTEPSLTISHLTKKFGDVLAVDDLSFAATKGRVTGFMGPNGAGKTTTLRALLGLITPTSGETLIGGRKYEALPEPMRVVGSHLDSASFNPGMTGAKHMKVMAAASGGDADRIDRLLAIVGLLEAAKRKVGGYSLGMKQRLGLATALLGDPQILVLDEPANGLDPEGITWLRDFLRSFAADGRTVLLSSHLLGEVQQVATDAVIINKGRLVAAGTVEELELQAGTRVEVGAADPAALSDALARAGLTLVRAGRHAAPRTEATTNNAPNFAPLIVKDATAQQVGEVAFTAGVPLTHLSEQVTGLETLFMEMVGGAK